MFTNARSLSPKIDSLVDMFDTLGIDFAAISETWLEDNERFMKNVRTLENKENLIIISRNRKARGGGVAIIYNKNKMSLNPVGMRGCDLEVVAAIGRTTQDDRKLLIISAYYPPNLKREGVDRLNDAISDTIDRQKEKHELLQVFLCGDMNRKDVTAILADHPDISVLQTPSTRNNDAIDLCMTNAERDSISVTKLPPLTTPDGRESDHSCILCEVKQPRRHIFRKIKFKTRPFSEKKS